MLDALWSVIAHSPPAHLGDLARSNGNWRQFTVVPGIPVVIA
jgi:hypothetical protein